MKLFFLILFSSVILAQEVSQPIAAKPASSSAVVQPGQPPILNTAKYWRLRARADELRQVANETPQAKAAAAADQAAQQEVNELAKVCGDKFQPSIDQNPQSSTHEDVICIPQPPASPAPQVPGK